jgi:hypothetical protein
LRLYEGWFKQHLIYFNQENTANRVYFGVSFGFLGKSQSLGIYCIDLTNPEFPLRKICTVESGVKVLSVSDSGYFCYVDNQSYECHFGHIDNPTHTTSSGCASKAIAALQISQNGKFIVATCYDDGFGKKCMFIFPDQKTTTSIIDFHSDVQTVSIFGDYYGILTRSLENGPIGTINVYKIPSTQYNTPPMTLVKEG